MLFLEFGKCISCDEMLVLQVVSTFLGGLFLTISISSTFQAESKTQYLQEIYE